MNFLLKQRLVGAIVLVALGVIFIPMLLEGPEQAVVPEMGALPELFDAGPEQPLESFPAADDLPAEPDVAVVNEPQAHDQEPVAQAAAEQAPPEAPAEPVQLPVPPAEPETQAADPGPLGNWVVQVGSFSNQEKAVALRDKLREGGFVGQVEKVRVDGKTFFRVRVGPYLERAEAEQDQKRLGEKFKLSPRVLSYP